MAEINFVGERLGNYRVIRRLGEGGFGTVYLGEHVYLKTLAALKILHARLSTADLARFLTEARVVARLDHPHIVRVLEFGIEEQGQIPYLVMNYAPHGTIRRRYPRGTAVPLPLLVTGVRQIAGALQYAHDHGVIHRDVKPENILLGGKGETLLSDFGLAIIVQEDGKKRPRLRAGTTLYMAPEQLQGDPGRASDQYALGILTYEWLCGQPPFRGSDPEIALQHIQAPPAPLHTHIPDLSLTIENIVLRTLEKDPAQRFPRIENFAHALEDAYRELGTLPSQEIRLVEDEDARPGVFALFSDASTLPETPSLAAPFSLPETGDDEVSVKPTPITGVSFPQTSSEALSQTILRQTSDNGAEALSMPVSEPSSLAFPPVPNTSQELATPSTFVPATLDDTVSTRSQELPEPAKPVSRPRGLSRRKLIAGLLIAGLLGGSGVVWYFSQQAAPLPVSRPGKQAGSPSTASGATQTVPSQVTPTEPASSSAETPTEAAATSTPEPTVTGEPATPDAQASPTVPVETATVQATASATPPGVFRVEIDTGLLPLELTYGGTYDVPVVTTRPGCTVTLTANYTLLSDEQMIGTQQSGNDGKTVFSWEIKSRGLLGGLLSLTVRLKAVAVNGEEEAVGQKDVLVVAL